MTYGPAWQPMPNQPPPPGDFPSTPQRHSRLVVVTVTIVVVAALLVAAVLVFNWRTNTDSTGQHHCPPGTHWGYGGNPTNMTPQQIEDASSCLSDGAAYKPMIYLYPASDVAVTVTLSRPAELTVSYPSYGDGWRVRAAPDGTLTDPANGQHYYGLYYESRVTPVHIQADGFVVPGSEVAAFLEKTLTTLGLSWREAEEFIVYWLPQMQDNPYNYIRFESLDEIDANQTLTISPQPDSMIRIWMTWQPLSQPISVSPQPLTPQTRSGFTAVEWGGIRIV